MKKTVISAALATVVATVIGCSTMAPVSMRGAAVPVKDSAPEHKSYAQKTPGVGEQKLIPRTFVNQPPMIPHSIEKYTPLTIDENACMECHQTDELRGKPVPQIGKSHFLDQGKGQKELSMARFQCDSCHVPQVDAPPLVENQFVGVTK